MKKNMRRVGIFSLGILLSVSLIGCSAENQTSITGDKDKVPVRVGFFPNITHAQALVGQANGLFQQTMGEAHQIQWKPFNAGPAEIEALFSGELDMGYIGPGPAINANAKSKGDVQIIAGATNAGAILVSKNDIIIKDIKDLNGKRVAIPQFGNTQDLTLRDLLNHNGLRDTSKGGTVEILPVANPDLKTLLEKGEIHAALVPEPWGSILIKDSQANIVLEYDQVWREGNYSSAVIIVRTQFLKEHPDLVEKFLKAHVDITDYINNNKDEAKQMINQQIGEFTKKPLADDVLDSAFKRLTITHNPEKDALIDFAKLLKESGLLRQKIDTSRLYDFSILNHVLEAKGVPIVE